MSALSDCSFVLAAVILYKSLKLSLSECFLFNKVSEFRFRLASKSYTEYNRYYGMLQFLLCKISFSCR